MGIRAVFDALAERIGPEVAFVGPEKKDSSSKPPRISWDAKAGKQEHPTGNNGHALKRTWVLEVEVWHKDFDQAEALVNLFMAHVHELLTPNSYRPCDEAWNTGGVSGNGSICMLTLMVVAPIPKLQPVTIKLVEADVKAKIGNAQVTTNLTTP